LGTPLTGPAPLTSFCFIPTRIHTQRMQFSFPCGVNHPCPPWWVCYSRDIQKEPVHCLEQPWLYTEVIGYGLGESQCIPQR
jgi:hypothetical protein